MHPVIKNGPDGLWCGPAAIALLTGLSVGAIDMMVRCLRRNEQVGDWTTPVHGMNHREVIEVLGMLGYITELLYSSEATGPATLGRFLRHYRRRMTVPVLLRIKGHFAVLDNDKYADSLFPEGIPIDTPSRIPHPRRPLLNAWWVMPFDWRPA